MCWPILVIVKDSCFRVGLSQLSRGQGVVRDDRGLANHSHGRPLRIRPPSELARKGISTPLLATGPLILLLSRNTRDELHRSRSATKLNQVVAMMRTAAVAALSQFHFIRAFKKQRSQNPTTRQSTANCRLMTPRSHRLRRRRWPPIVLHQDRCRRPCVHPSQRLL